MTVSGFLEELRSRDIELWPDGDQLRCSAPAGVLTPDLRAELQRRKPEIVNFLHTAKALAQQQRAIVPLQQRGNRIPVFAVPGHNGDVFCYRLLAEYLGDDQPFYGLQPPGVDGQSEPLTSVEELARLFASQIRAFQPRGLYAIAGYCAGGVIAVELARQLLQQGSNLTYVVLLAGGFPDTYRVLPRLGRRISYEAKRARKHVRALLSLPSDRKRAYLVEKLKSRRAVASPTADPVWAWRRKVERVTRTAVTRYVPTDFPGRLSLLLPSSDCLRAGHSMRKWRSIARTVDEYCGPQGCEGDTMLLEPHVRSIAELFRLCRDNGDRHAS